MVYGGVGGSDQKEMGRRWNGGLRVRRDREGG